MVSQGRGLSFRKCGVVRGPLRVGTWVVGWLDSLLCHRCVMYNCTHAPEQLPIRLFTAGHHQLLNQFCTPGKVFVSLIVEGMKHISERSSCRSLKNGATGLT